MIYRSYVPGWTWYVVGGLLGVAALAGRGYSMSWPGVVLFGVSLGLYTRLAGPSVFIVLVPAALALALFLGEIFRTGKRPHALVIGCLVAALCLVLGPLALIVAGVPLELQSCPTTCGSNLKNIATALEIYSIDHHGSFPEDLEQLSPDYLREIPRCLSENPSALGRTLYRGAGIEFKQYRYLPDGQDFQVLCETGIHYGGAGYPNYTSREGLVSSP